jgi:Fic family protein
MKPPYEITPSVLGLVSSISMKLGEVKANFLSKPSPLLRKQNKIKTIHSSLSIEGNTLSQEQITAILENKRVIGPRKEIKEVLNANEVYSKIKVFNPYLSKSFLSAHKILMSELLEAPGKYRSEDVGIIHGTKVAHIAPQPENVPTLMNGLFNYLKNDPELTLIKSCVFHYEMEFIHPFADGNGRMGRFWQTVILMKEYPVFEYIPFETLINESQSDYYKALKASDTSGNSTSFLEYMLKVIDISIDELLSQRNNSLSDSERLEYFMETGKQEFTRKDYMETFKSISSATASRDLKKGLDIGLFEKTGYKNRTIYKKTTGHNK